MPGQLSEERKDLPDRGRNAWTSTNIVSNVLPSGSTFLLSISHGPLNGLPNFYSFFPSSSFFFISLLSPFPDLPVHPHPQTERLQGDGGGLGRSSCE